MEGRITRIISNLYTVTVEGKEYFCNARGKFRIKDITPSVGDFCEIDPENNYILDIKPRKNELTRPMISNVDVALIITSVKKPDLSLNLLDKQLSLIILNKIEPIICLTKLDLLNEDEAKEIDAIAKYYESIGIKVVNNNQKAEIEKIISDNLVVLTGQTGAGKSTLLNTLNKELNLETKPISEALGRGVHTTRHVELFNLFGGLIADTPGFSALDFKNVNKEKLRNSFIEFKNYPCEFKDCMHIKEINCGVIEAVEDKNIMKSRHGNYKKFIAEVK